MRTMLLKELVSHDVLEFCYDIRHPQNWNADSIFVSDDDFYCLNPYLEQVIPDFSYYASQKITTEQWEQIEKLALEDGKFRDFFQKIKEQKSKDPEGSNSFWIHGVQKATIKLEVYQYQLSAHKK